MYNVKGYVLSVEQILIQICVNVILVQWMAGGTFYPQQE